MNNLNMANLNLANLSMDEIQLLLAANAANVAAQAQMQQQNSRQSTPASGNSNNGARTARTPTPTQQNGISNQSLPNSSSSSSSAATLDAQSQSKYQQLLSVIEEMSKDIRPTYAGSKSSAERLKRGIVYARILVRECLVETERSARN